MLVVRHPAHTTYSGSSHNMPPTLPTKRNAPSTTSPSSAPPSKRPRPDAAPPHLVKLQTLLEFWLSSINLSKDRFLLSEMLKDDGWISPVLFTKFNKVVSLQATESHILQALRNIHKPPLEFQESDCDKVLVRIKGGIQKLNDEVQQLTKDEEERTIYVEPLHADTTRAEIKDLFAAFGEVVYISIPRFNDGRCKGFCFIEFTACVSARTAVDAANQAQVHSERLRDLRALMRAEWRERKEAFKDAKKKQRIEVARRRHASIKSPRALAPVPEPVPTLTSARAPRIDIPPPSSPVAAENFNTSHEKATAANHVSKSKENATAITDDPCSHLCPSERGVILSISGLLHAKTKPTRRLLYECVCQFGDVAFIDFTPRSADVCKVRFACAESAAKAMAALSAAGGANMCGTEVRVEILEGEKEEEYWRHIQEKRKARNERQKRKDERGQDRRVEGRVQPRRKAKQGR